MMIYNEYLSDEELHKLISETETDIVPAPPDLKEEILIALFGEPEKAKSNRILKREASLSERGIRQQPLEFARYCFRVVTTVAAAVAFIMIMPYLPGLSETALVDNIQTEIRQEVLWELKECPTKEEVLNEKSFWEKAFGSNQNENSFIKEDGGN